MADDPRSYEVIREDDLIALAAVAERDLRRFVARNPRHQDLPDRVLLVAMCQGAALHYLDGTTGVKDFDVWTFFSFAPGRPDYPVRRRGVDRFDGERFGDSTRRVDLLGRTLSRSHPCDPLVAVQDYLAKGATPSARALSDKAVIALSPAPLRGRVVWPTRSSAGAQAGAVGG